MSGLDITPKPASGRQLIDGYGGGGFKIAGQRYSGSVIVFPTRTLAWPVTGVDQITRASLSPSGSSSSAAGGASSPRPRL